MQSLFLRFTELLHPPLFDRLYSTNISGNVSAIASLVVVCEVDIDVSI